MRRFDLTRLAKADLMSIARFTETRWGRKQRNAYLKEFDQIFRSLAENPLIGRVCEEILPDYRKHPHGSHVIYYTLPNESELLIVRILHGTMDAESNLDA